MAVPHFSVSIVARGSGRSAVMSAAYRHCAKMEFERESRTVDYGRKQGLAHEEFAIPSDAPGWLRDMIADRSVSGVSEAFWNKVELFEKRGDAQLAKDVTIALPIELTTEQNIALVRDFVERHITARGMVADWVIHDNPGNPHIHLMTTLRPLAETGFGPKKVALTGPDGQVIRNDAGKIVYELWAGSTQDFNAFRDGWFACQNQHLAMAGLDIRVDGRSFERQGIALEPTIHLGVGVKAIERKAESSEEKAALERLAQQEEMRAENARRIESRPELVLDLITRERSVFDSGDIAKVLHRYVDDPALFQNLMARILQSPDVLRLERERIDLVSGVRAPSRYTTRELIRLEAEMARRASFLSRASSHHVHETVLNSVFARHTRLSDEQRTAIEHVAGPQRIAAVIGRAGAGKTTMMKAAREAWEAAGYRVVGGALAGKAAEGLEKEAGIPSRTLSSWELRWRQGRDLLDARSVFVLDEAGMVSSRQMALFVEAVSRAGAKLVLVGDPEQLQPIEAGAAFRAIADRIGYAELETIYRQNAHWMRDASLDLARGRIDRAVEAYSAQGRMIGAELKADAVNRLIADWTRDYDPDRSMLILAHLRRDVRMLNKMARGTLVERGIIEAGSLFKTAEGHRHFAAGDQIVFLKNEGSLGVKNGMLAKVVEASPGRLVAVVGEAEHRRHVIVEQRFYNTLDHGYATTVHKSQGATVDRVKVLASLSLDRHLTYVAMTRHRQDLAVYYGTRSFAKAGGLVRVLGRSNAKETTLDYAGGRFYADALRFAEARGLHLVQVARTLVRDRLEWTVRQGAKLAELGARLAAIGTRLGLVAPRPIASPPSATVKARPMVSGITAFPKPLAEVVEDKLQADPALQYAWKDISARFHLVYADPQLAFRAVNIETMLENDAVARSTITALLEKPDSFGALKGKTGLFAGSADVQTRKRALANAPTLARDIEAYIAKRTAAASRYEVEEVGVRQRLSLDIPALSPSARQALEGLRDAIDRNDVSAGPSLLSMEKAVKAELDGFGKAVATRFGERSFLPITARDADGKAFEALSTGMSPAQKTELRSAWDLLRAAQKLAAYERTTVALKQAEALRQTQSKGLSLK
ncbi:Ti-type conjugative transfer relaxase TraA [Rhizobium sp. AAP43]|uniref:Ti-type conjugative transfer relaxase TraA n=1 Tax=Rhizobium sp. AAP43 TaxID=1523420 RepID=UPI0006B96588|nr:Ti-type conjugative transfer relaxase TraA [Rhizobium sp. AAP43]KPF44613.1 Dtr system oriT relaxase [Rhizobium sp. AAP43]